MKTIVEINPDNTVVAYGEGSLYKGTPTMVGFDEMDVETVITPSGFERVTKFDGQIIGKCTLNKEVFFRDWSLRVKTSHPEWNESEVQRSVESMWDKEIEIDGHEKHFCDAIDSNGNLIRVEKKLKLYKWEKI